MRAYPQGGGEHECGDILYIILLNLALIALLDTSSHLKQNRRSGQNMPMFCYGGPNFFSLRSIVADDTDWNGWVLESLGCFFNYFLTALSWMFYWWYGEGFDSAFLVTDLLKYFDCIYAAVSFLYGVFFFLTEVPFWAPVIHFCILIFILAFWGKFYKQGPYLELEKSLGTLRPRRPKPQYTLF